MQEVLFFFIEHAYFQPIEGSDKVSTPTYFTQPRYFIEVDQDMRYLTRMYILFFNSRNKIIIFLGVYYIKGQI